MELAESGTRRGALRVDKDDFQSTGMQLPSIHPANQDSRRKIVNQIHHSNLYRRSLKANLTHKPVGLLSKHMFNPRSDSGTLAIRFLFPGVEWSATRTLAMDMAAIAGVSQFRFALGAAVGRVRPDISTAVIIVQ